MLSTRLGCNHQRFSIHWFRRPDHLIMMKITIMITTTLTTIQMRMTRTIVRKTIVMMLTMILMFFCGQAALQVVEELAEVSP